MIVLLLFSCKVVFRSLSPHNCSTPVFPVLHYILEFNQTPVRWFSDVIEPSHPLYSPSLPLQSSPVSGSFPMSQLFTSGGQRTGASASASVFAMTIQGWFTLGLTGLISLQSKGLSRVFSSTTIRKHQLFSVQSPLWPNSHIHTWLTHTSIHDYWKNHSFD